jgi:hypothetical protein
MKIRRAHVPEIDRFPKAKTGDLVRFVRADEQYPLWFCGFTEEGLEGFFPRDWFEPCGEEDRMHAVRDYDSTELAMEEGSEVLVIEEYGEWALVDAGDRVGWIPSACLDR